jgi:hypothetical protein
MKVTHMVFASDYPYPGGAERGGVALEEVIKSMAPMNIREEEKAKNVFKKRKAHIESVLTRS